MRIATSIWTGVALLAMVQAAEAAPPLVSGKYALMSFTQCEARFTTTPTTTTTFLKTIGAADGTGSHTHPTTSGPGVGTLNPSDSGELGIGVGIINFLPAAPASSGGATLALTIVSGGSLRINTTGEAVATHTENVTTATYAFTNTTFTFTPAGEPAMTWQMRPGNGVRTLYMVRRESARCVNAVTATKQ